MKVGRGVQAISRFVLMNLKGCNVGIIDGKDAFEITSSSII
jgi:hypothetical protein